MSTTSYTYAPGCAAKTSTQTTGSRYGFEYGYNLAGALTAEKYPSGRVVQMSYDAVGRPTAVCNGTCAGSDKYASGITYAKYGLPTSMTLGNGVLEARDYNNRLQVTSIAAGTLWSITNSYAIAPSNNGNVMGQTISGSAVTGATRSYGYDSLNRLGSASQSAWSETYSYDRFGNRAVTRTGTLPGLVSGGETATLLSQYDTATNRRGTSTGFSYDQRGNVTAVSGRPDTKYDAENHQISSVNVNGSSSYAYDGDGRRVSKTVSGTTTTFVYDAMGQLAAEYGGTPVSAGRQYVTVDHLGSTRLVTTTTGTVATPPSDYLPFGEELGVTCLNAPDAVKFTGHFRDQESCLDFAEARMMSSAQGRFTSPDEPFADQSEGDPQSWNLFSYVRNNPLNATDPSGRDCIYLDNVSNGTAGVETGLNCSRAGGTYVAGTIDQSSVLYSRSSGQVSYSYTSYSGDRGGTGVISLGQDQGGAFISEMARRATASKQMIAVGALSGPTAVAATYAPAAIAVAGRALMGMGAAAGPISVVFRAAQLAHATRVEPGHNTPLGTVQEIQSAVVAAVEKGSYSVSPGGVVKGTTYIQGVAHEFTGFLKASGDIVFSNIYRK